MKTFKNGKQQRQLKPQEVILQTLVRKMRREGKIITREDLEEITKKENKESGQDD